MSIIDIIRSIWRVVADALFPLSEAERTIAALSPETAFEALPPAPPYDASVAPLPGALSVFAYKDERVSRLVWNIKYKKDRHAAAIAAFALHSALKGMNVPRLLIIPMPSTPRRRRERGYNQCEFLADSVAGLDAGGRIVIEKRLLRRIRHASHQKLKGRAERLVSAKGIFEVDQAEALRVRNDPGSNAARMIVLDDVITTGTTMREALDELKKAGFDAAGLSLAH